AEPGRHFHGVHQRHADDARVEVHRRAHVFRIQRQVMNATGGKLYRLRLATGQCFALHDFSFLSTRTVAIAFATSVPSSFFASASTKLMLRPSFITRASAQSVAPLPAPMNEVLMLMVITPTDSGCSVRAAVHSATSSSDMMTPPCTVPRLLVRCGSTGNERRAVPLSSVSVRILRCERKGMRFW